MDIKSDKSKVRNAGRLSIHARFLILTLGLIPVILCGCVERELFLKTDPPGALVCIDGKNVGQTPVSIPFYYYGHRKIEFRLKNYKAEQVLLELDPPWYQVFPLDFMFDLLWPATLNDVHSYEFELVQWKPENLDDQKAILDRAQLMRKKQLFSADKSE